MIEYSCFDFGSLGVEKRYPRLKDFVHFVDAEFDFSLFAADVLLVCVRDVVIELEFLHRSRLPLRDLAWKHSRLQPTLR